MKKPFITLTSDFGVQSQGTGIMEAVALEINPDAHTIHLMHGLPDFDLFYAARTMETVAFMPVGFHVCVVDPGVGTKRKPIIIETGRGDFLIGPDNGVLIPATRFLGGIKKAAEITNKKYMRQPVSPIFHGRDIFTPAAAYLSKGIGIEKFGKNINPKNLAKAPYEEAVVKEDKISAKIISINKFGSLHLNIMQKEWDKFNVGFGNIVILKFKNQSIGMPHAITFGDIEKGKPLIMKDDYGRIEIAINQGSFAKKYSLKIGDNISIKK
ncbi:SAM-dependent chlorinase/fluorinase [Candidatus Woesearchaeota archaeon]|nr:SAM-dependent chlorinase/fluorinase [Candidatus Woesearchaeota archaeon]